MNGSGSRFLLSLCYYCVFIINFYHYFCQYWPKDDQIGIEHKVDDSNLTWVNVITVIATVFSDNSPGFACIPVYTLVFGEVIMLTPSDVPVCISWLLRAELWGGTDTNAEARGPQLSVKSLRILEPEATIEKGIGPVIDVSTGWLYCGWLSLASILLICQWVWTVLWLMSDITMPKNLGRVFIVTSCSPGRTQWKGRLT